ncbi:MAG: hypothetical protein ACFFCV_05610 [Promethearchaeota archaeon]
MPIDFSKYQKKATQKVKITPEKKKEPKIQKPTEKELEVSDVFSTMTITQDDLWFFYRLKTGKGTRLPKKNLLPELAEVFNRELKEMKGGK